MVKAQRIYVAGPYSSLNDQTRKANVDKAIDAAVQLLQKGHFPFVPHLTHFVDEWTKHSGIELSWEDYIAWDVVWLKECDALFYIGPSRGADLERSIAEYLGMPIFESMDEVPEGDGRTTVHTDVAHLLAGILETRRNLRATA